ncbi:MAG: tetratricopeptide repeat protein [Cyclobacteriaceae bacterium]
MTVDLFEKGKSHFNSGKFEEALFLFNQLVGSSPQDTSYLHYRARVFSRLGKFDDALKDFDLLIKSHPYDTNFISDRAVVLHLLKRNEEALNELDRALNLDPNNPYRYSSRAYFKDRIGDLKGAILDYEAAIAMDPEDAVSLNNKGLVEEKLGYQDASRSSFQKADRLSEILSPLQDTPINRTNDKQDHSLKKDSAQNANLSPETKTLGIQHYWNILKGIFKNDKTRAEFFGFIKSKFKSS